MNKNYHQNTSNFHFWCLNFGWYIKESKKISHRFLKIYSFCSVFSTPLICNLAMPRYGKVLTTNLSCSDSELWLGSLKLLGSGGFLFTETFKALCQGTPQSNGRKAWHIFLHQYIFATTVLCILRNPMLITYFLHKYYILFEFH